ncbi:hypothetical protein BCF46_2077 [Litoreibacter meonggei]|uniref:Uncharacterized protein n=1 Tax=Litoreibacter meonggei TaxID=1049199 RepID=A0A497W7A4_9RHOB|nr:hypothetical protein [Litoreibacter meonggei]RLJ51852.1 hypothetical protein BCF46_2077 [Litoreibacter meonggei]
MRNELQIGGFSHFFRLGLSQRLVSFARLPTLLGALTLAAFTIPGYAHDIFGLELRKLPNFTWKTQARLKVAYWNAPDSFRPEFLAADSAQLLDDIAQPVALSEADLAIIFLKSQADFRKLPIYDEIENLEAVILTDPRAVAKTFDLSAQFDGPTRPLRLFLYFFDRDADEVGFPVSDTCFATHIYGLAVFDESKDVLARMLSDCNE